MSAAIVGKLLGWVLLSCGGIMTVMYIAINSTPYIPLSGTDSNNIYIYVVSKDVDNQPTEEIKTGKDEKNYQCKFDNKYYECELSIPAAFDVTTKQINITKLKSETTSQNITNNELKAKDKIYRIKIHSLIRDWTLSDLTIDIYPNPLTKTNSEQEKIKTYASLKPLFAINSNDSINEHTKTQYFVVKNKTTTTSSDAVSTPITHTCLTSKTTISEVTKATADCKVYDFSSDTDVSTKTLDTTNFAKKTTESDISSSKTNNQHYLVKLGTPVQADEVKHIKIKPSTGSDVLFANDEITPAIRTTEDDDNIFILKKADQASEPNSQTTNGSPATE